MEQFKLQCIMCVSRCFKNIFWFWYTNNRSCFFLFSNAFPWSTNSMDPLVPTFWDPQGSALIGPAKLWKLRFLDLRYNPSGLGAYTTLYSGGVRRRSQTSMKSNLICCFKMNLSKWWSILSHMVWHQIILAYPFASKFRILQLHYIVDVRSIKIVTFSPDDTS